MSAAIAGLGAGRVGAAHGDMARLGQGMYLAAQPRFEPLTGWRGPNMQNPLANLRALQFALAQQGRPAQAGRFQVY